MLLRLAVTTFASALVFGALGSADSPGISSPVRVVQGGFSSDRFSRSAANVSYGVVLKNESNRDAIHVRVTAVLVSSSGATLGSDAQTVSFIPAGKTFGVGGQISIEGPRQQARLGTSVSVGAMRPAHLVLPPVKVHDMGGAYDGSITNPYSQVIYTADANLFDVQYDSHHRIIGGEPQLVLTTGLDETLPPHQKREIQFLSVPPRGKTVASVAVWADPGFVPR